MKTVFENGSTTDIYAGLINSFLITLLLLFLDEGFKHLGWVTDPFSWLMFCVYMAIIFPSQYLQSKFLFQSVSGYKKIALVSLLGFPFTLFAFWLLFKKLN